MRLAPLLLAALCALVLFSGLGRVGFLDWREAGSAAVARELYRAHEEPAAHDTIEGIENFPDNKVSVFNRWGSLVFEKKGYTNENGWDGNWINGLLPAA